MPTATVLNAAAAASTATIAGGRTTAVAGGVAGGQPEGQREPSGQPADQPDQPGRHHDQAEQPEHPAEKDHRVGRPDPVDHRSNPRHQQDQSEQRPAGAVAHPGPPPGKHRHRVRPSGLYGGHHRRRHPAEHAEHRDQRDLPDGHLERPHLSERPDPDVGRDAPGGADSSSDAEHRGGQSQGQPVGQHDQLEVAGRAALGGDERELPATAPQAHGEGGPGQQHNLDHGQRHPHDAHEEIVDPPVVVRPSDGLRRPVAHGRRVLQHRSRQHGHTRLIDPACLAPGDRRRGVHQPGPFDRPMLFESGRGRGGDQRAGQSDDRGAVAVRLFDHRPHHPFGHIVAGVADRRADFRLQEGGDDHLVGGLRVAPPYEREHPCRHRVTQIHLPDSRADVVGPVPVIPEALTHRHDPAGSDHGLDLRP
ncbi:hypothetical protein [Streptosporangium subroseum]|uniref:hypothetical protein n=1 Tax=Streptosporangium subroseum TaxID=106412 RepID=UPI003F4DFE4C